MKIAKIQKTNINLVQELLIQCDLPANDIQQCNQEFFGLYLNNELIAVAGLETYSDASIFRSLAVKNDFRSKGYGTAIYDFVINHAKSKKLNNLYLLTTTAPSFFQKKGWHNTERDKVPEGISSSLMFKESCPSEASCMQLSFINGPVSSAEKYFSNDFNCAQSVLTAFAPSLGLEEDVALKLTTGFGSGIAQKGEICGAVSGAYMAIGLKYGKSKTNDNLAKKNTLEKINQFDRIFIEKHKSLYCKSLLGYDLSTPEGLKKALEKNKFNTVCAALVKSSSQILNTIINN